MIIVRHAKTKNAVNIGRGTPLGNPFKLTDEKYRNDVCNKYEQWLNHHLRPDIQSSFVVNELNRLIELANTDTLILGCPGNCHPKRCHGDYIKTVLEYNIKLKNAI